jgi:hypothetical protein
MDKKIETRYTNAAYEQLQKFKQQQVDILEDKIISSKSYPGAEFIEVTGADIQEFSKDFIVKKSISKSNLRYLIVYLYFVIGIGLLTFGIFYNELIEIFYNQPKQAIYIITGLTMSLVSVILMFYIKYREKRIDEIRKDSFKKEKMPPYELDELIKIMEERKKEATHNNG